MFKTYYNSVEREFGIIVYLDPTMDGHNSALFQAFATDLDDGVNYHLIGQNSAGKGFNYGYIRANNPMDTARAAWTWLYREARDYLRGHGE